MKKILMALGALCLLPFKLLSILLAILLDKRVIIILAAIIVAGIIGLDIYLVAAKEPVSQVTDILDAQAQFLMNAGIDTYVDLASDGASFGGALVKISLIWGGILLGTLFIMMFILVLVRLLVDKLSELFDTCVGFVVGGEIVTGGMDNSDMTVYLRRKKYRHAGIYSIRGEY